jgi:hypothetical protein
MSGRKVEDDNNPLTCISYQEGGARLNAPPLPCLLEHHNDHGEQRNRRCLDTATMLSLLPTKPITHAMLYRVIRANSTAWKQLAYGNARHLWKMHDSVHPIRTTHPPNGSSCRKTHILGIASHVSQGYRPAGTPHALNRARSRDLC